MHVITDRKEEEEIRDGRSQRTGELGRRERDRVIEETA